MQDEQQNIIYWHPHPDRHRIRNANSEHIERHVQSFNEKFAVFLTRNVGSMATAYAFVFLALIGLLSILGYLTPLVALLVTWLSQTFIQLVLLPVIMVGNNTISKHQEIQADIVFKDTEENLRDAKLLIEHLNAQDTELIKHTEMLSKLANILMSLNGRLAEFLDHQAGVNQYLSHELNDVKHLPNAIRKPRRPRNSEDN